MNDFELLETKWQKYWDKHPEIFEAKDLVDDKTKPNNLSVFDKSNKKYILNEFPYPSGSGLHVGHTFSFTGGDICARFKRMQGYNVLFPMGWDAFGLPTENYAIKMKRRPQAITKENTDMFRKQMKRLAFSFDWKREVDTTDPYYYRWTQWIFIQLFKKGLAYKKEMPINWCPSCKIGLANEEVINGRCERCGTQVTRKNISQWVVKITEYADKLIEGLKETEFIDKVKQQQINWIGKSEGSKVNFKIFEPEIEAKELEVFTTRPDTLFGVTFMVVSPEHFLVQQIIDSPNFKTEQKQIIKDYIKSARKKSEMERTDLSRGKTGVFSGLYAINPVNDKQIPIWISDFVLLSYGTGAIMSVPGHDERDKEFADKFGLEVVYVFNNDDVVINSGFLDGLKKEGAIKKMNEWLEKNKIGEKSSSYHLRDWIFSRQHYWGEPIPMVYCKSCSVNKNNKEIKNKINKYAKEQKIKLEALNNNPGWYPVLEIDLPVVLPEVEAYEPTDDGKSPLSKIDSFIKSQCPVCHKEAQRETDTMPNWAGSDWYFLGYCFANKINDSYFDNNSYHQKLLADIFSNSQNELSFWGPVDLYIGGDEHNVLHLLYSRFIYKFLWDLGVLPREIREPYFKRMSHGVILGPDGQRMSKSKGNVIVPETVADKYGVDVLRMYLMFMGPFDSTMAWNENTLMGVKRFLDRFSNFIKSMTSNFYKEENIVASSTEVEVIINKLVKGVTEDLENFKFNTAIAKMMEGLNRLSSVCFAGISIEDIKTLIKLLAPFAPYLSEELWFVVVFNNNSSTLEIDYCSVHLSSWPEAKTNHLTNEKLTVAVAINGKVRDQLVVNNNESLTNEEVFNKAKKLEKIKKWLDGKKIKKEIYIEGKMINFVI